MSRCLYRARCNGPIPGRRGNLMTLHIGASASLCALAAGLISTAAVAETQQVRPRFTVIQRSQNEAKQNTALTQWNFKYTYNKNNYSEIFVGTDPSKGAVATTVPVYIIPIELSFDGFKTNPLGKLKGQPKGTTVISNIVASPIFSSALDFQEDKTDLGSTQYVDAFQKLNLWNVGGSATGYHTLLGTPTIEKPMKLTVPANDGAIGTPIDGIKVLEANLSWLDNLINAQITKLKIPSNAFPLFIVTQTYLTSGGCCIGGYHSVTNSGIPYGVSTYIVNSGKTVTFSQDVGALSHEISEWMDDPFTNNRSPCGIYEVGDPLERETNYGLYPYTLGKFTYHLQDEATPVYFGAPAADTLGGYPTFQGTQVKVCANGS
jgi:hypothetical protein